MSTIALVTGSKTSIGKKIIEKLLAEDVHVLAPIPAEYNKKDIAINNKSKLITLSWNPSSWFSTKSMIREIIHRYKTINTAFILHSRINFEKDFLQTAYSEIDSILDSSIRANVILLRELIPVLTSSGGFLGMIVPHRGNWQVDALCSLNDGAFIAFAQSIIHEHKTNFWPCGFYSKLPDTGQFSSEIIQTLQEKPPKLRGKWLLYNEGRKPFGGSVIKESI